MFVLCVIRHRNNQHIQHYTLIYLYSSVPLGAGVGGFNPLPTNSEVFIKLSRIPSSLKNTSATNNLIRIRVSLICKLSATLTRGLPPPDRPSLCPLSSNEFDETLPLEQNSWVHHWICTTPLFYVLAPICFGSSLYQGASWILLSYLIYKSNGTTTLRHTGHVTTHYMIYHPFDLYFK
jgi:hypothetical protein